MKAQKEEPQKTPTLTTLTSDVQPLKGGRINFCCLSPVVCGITVMAAGAKGHQAGPLCHQRTPTESLHHHPKSPALCLPEKIQNEQSVGGIHRGQAVASQSLGQVEPIFLFILSFLTPGMLKYAPQS